MKPIILVLLFGLLSACGETSKAVQPIPQVGPSIVTGASASVNPRFGHRELGVALNQIRRANGVRPITHNAKLGRAAQLMAQDMLARNYFAHKTPEGKTVGDRARAQGYIWRAIGENIAQGQRSIAQVMQSWTNSPGHHANNISPNFTEFGFGVAGSGGNTRWVLVLGQTQ